MQYGFLSPIGSSIIGPQGTASVLSGPRDLPRFARHISPARNFQGYLASSQISTRVAPEPRYPRARTRITTLAQVAQRTSAIHASAQGGGALVTRPLVHNTSRVARNLLTRTTARGAPRNAAEATSGYHVNGTFLRTRTGPPPRSALKPSDPVCTPAAAVQTPAGSRLEQRAVHGHPPEVGHTSAGNQNAQRIPAKTGPPRERVMPSALARPSGRIAGGASPLLDGAFGVCEIRNARQVNSRSWATARTQTLPVTFFIQRKSSNAAAQRLTTLHVRRTTGKDANRGLHGHLLRAGTRAAFSG